MGLRLVSGQRREGIEQFSKLQDTNAKQSSHQWLANNSMTNKEGSKSELDDFVLWADCNRICKQMHNGAWGMRQLASHALKTYLEAVLKALNTGESPMTPGDELRMPSVERIQSSTSFDFQTITNPNNGITKSRKRQHGFNENLPSRSRTIKKPGKQYVPGRTTDSAIDKTLNQTEPLNKL